MTSYYEIYKPLSLFSYDCGNAKHSIETWTMSLLAASLVGASGIVPLLIIPANSDNVDTVNNLPSLLSFAVGALLGDVFLHLLPEAYQNISPGDNKGLVMIGMWCIVGIVSFLIMEKLMTSQIGPSDQHNDDKHSIKVTGWLNLLANAVDNFTHGLAVAASFTIGMKSGVLTTVAILFHEVPHEIGDFAILLRSGFSRWDAAKAQLITASGALIGAFVALTSESMKNTGDRTAWVLPFTAGGFIYISLVSILPELLQYNGVWCSLKQLASLLSGIGIMLSVSYL